jgi:hypothetical protein
MARIPDKDTDREAYQRYYRDRRVLDDLIAQQRSLEAIAYLERDPARRGQFTKALGHIEDAIEAWRAGWSEPYARPR